MSSCPPQPPGALPYGYAEPPGDYLAWSILATLFCCIPLGVVSILYSTQVNARWARGDVAGAHDASRKALRWAITSASCGVVFAVILLVVSFQT